jgi:GntR family transcriptional regulator / MocR family aminotransferase
MSCDQIASRFEQHELPVWTEWQELPRFIAGYPALLPLKKAAVEIHKRFVEYLLELSDGVTGSWILEDDYDTEFHSGDRPLPALRSLDLADRVLYVGSFSKTLFPSLRLGYIVCPKAIRDDLYKAKLMDDLGSAAMEQAALGTFMQSGQYEKHLRKSVNEIINRRRVIVKALQGLAGPHIEIGPHHAGTHFVIWLRHLSFDRLDALIEHAKSLGLGLHPIHPYYRTQPSRPGLLIGYAGLSVNQLRTAAELLGRCLDSESRGCNK